jgi:hypothetical protein
MKGFRQNRRLKVPGVLASSRRPTGQGLAVMVCLVLLALISMVQVTHLHQTATAADHCAICVVMHSAAPVAVAAAAVVLVQLGFSAPTVVALAPVRPWHSQLYIRPPPQY